MHTNTQMGAGVHHHHHDAHAMHDHDGHLNSSVLRVGADDHLHHRLSFSLRLAISSRARHSVNRRPAPDRVGRFPFG